MRFGLTALVILCALISHGQLLDNASFQDAPILSGGQTILGVGDQKAVFADDPSQISGIAGWSHGTNVDLGLVRTTAFGDASAPQVAFTNNWERRLSQTAHLIIVPGVAYEMAFLVGTALDEPLQPRAGLIEIIAGSVSASDPEQFEPGSSVIVSKSFRSSTYAGAGQIIPDRTWSVILSTFSVSEGDPRIGKYLSVSLQTQGSSAGPIYWKGIELLPVAGLGSPPADFTAGNSGFRVSGLDPTAPVSSSWLLPATWEKDSHGLRMKSTYPWTWALAPTGMTAGKLRYAQNLSATIKPTDWDGQPKPVFAVETANGTYFYTRNSFAVNQQNTISTYLTARGWRKDHYLTGPEPTEWQFYQDLQTATALHIGCTYGATTDTSILAVAIGIAQGQTGLTVNCGLMNEDWQGNPSDKPIRLEYFDQGTKVGEGSFVADNQTNYVGAVRYPVGGTFDIYASRPGYLSYRIPQVTLPFTGTMNLEFTNGDIDNDNAITVFDYGILSDYFDQSSADANWTTVGANGARPKDADLDGDGAVTVFDYGILSDHFDRSGDPPY